MSTDRGKDVLPEAAEQLSAYLDGELDPRAGRQIEERLAREPALRAELDQLERAWSMLDQLPRTEVSGKFAASTLEMVAIAAQHEADLDRAAVPTRRLAWRAAAACAALLSVAIGFWGGRLLWPDVNAALVRDLPVLEHLDAYRALGDIEFARRLEREGHFVEGPEP